MKYEIKAYWYLSGGEAVASIHSFETDTMQAPVGEKNTQLITEVKDFLAGQLCNILDKKETQLLALSNGVFLKSSVLGFQIAEIRSIKSEDFVVPHKKPKGLIDLG